MTSKLITVKYSCHKCGIYRKDIDIPARQEEDVIAWMNDIVTSALSKDYDTSSPLCIINSLSEVLIPIQQFSKKIGEGPTIQ